MKYSAHKCSIVNQLFVFGGHSFPITATQERGLQTMRMQEIVEKALQNRSISMNQYRRARILTTQDNFSASENLYYEALEKALEGNTVKLIR